MRDRERERERGRQRLYIDTYRERERVREKRDRDIQIDVPNARPHTKILLALRAKHPYHAVIAAEAEAVAPHSSR